MSKSTETGTFRCESCSVDFDSAEELKNHGEQVHGRRREPRGEEKDVTG